MPRSTGRRVNKQKKKKKYRKATIPKAIREQCWIQVFGEKFKEKCYINWCENEINVFDFHVGHDKPESKDKAPRDEKAPAEGSAAGRMRRVFASSAAW